MRISAALSLAAAFSLVNLAVAAESPQNNSSSPPELSSVTVKPKLIKREDPIYPYNQARAGVIGKVRIAFTINPQGDVIDAFVVESNNPAFERPAIDAVLKWKFSPGMMKGRAINVRASQEIDFSMDHGGSQASFWQISKGRNHQKLPPELQWDEAPQPVATMFPVYPFAALQAGIQGKTNISFIVGPEGTVVKAQVTEATTPEMGRAVLAMIDTWRFIPPKKKDGTPVYAALELEHNFFPSGMGDVPVTRAADRILDLLKKHPERIVSAGQLDEMPKPISRRPPVYPLALRAAHRAGRAAVEFFIDEQGDVQLPQIISSSAPEFGYAAVQAVSAWRFAPATIDHRAVIVRVRQPLEFTPQPIPPPHP